MLFATRREWKTWMRQPTSSRRSAIMLIHSSSTLVNFEQIAPTIGEEAATELDRASARD